MVPRLPAAPAPAPVPAPAHGLRARPVVESDRAVLLDLFGQDRPAVLLELQLDAREEQYAVAYPDAVDQLLELDGDPVGRLMVAWVTRAGGSELRVVDLVVTHRARRQGVGAAALAPWLSLAREWGVPVTLQVAAGNPAVDFYASLGFRPVPGPDDPTSPSTHVSLRLDPQELPR